MQYVDADAAWLDGKLQSGVRIGVRDGKIASIEPKQGSRPGAKVLTDRILLPGLVNAHSHAFQVGLRGRGEHFPRGMGDFWSWREAMYALVSELDRSQFRRLYERAFAEMLAAGFTTVGEFHYLHHEDAEKLDYAFDELVLEAAAAVGIRLVLLLSYYRTGGFGQALYGGQRRFSTPSVDDFLHRVDWLERRLDRATQSIGIAPHSLRAVPPDDLIRLHKAALERGLVCHIHVEEQRREISDCQAALGCSPMAWILDHLSVGGELTVIHGTHTPPTHIDRFIQAGGRFCVCPITEGNLGDGIGDVARMARGSDSLCIGTDSNVCTDPWQELRWLEFGQRLRCEKRGVLAGDDGNLAPRLLAVGSRGGAAALGLRSGKIEVGRSADFIAVKPKFRLTDGVDPLAAFIFSSEGNVEEVCVGGQWRPGSGPPPAIDKPS